MEVNTEVKRIITLSLGKLYSSRSQRGGMKLHRSLLLSLVMRTARDIYHSARLASESGEWQPATAQSVQEQPATEEQMDTSGAQVETSAPQLTSPLDSQLSEVEKPGHPSYARSTEDEENRSPASPGCQSRKRRGKASAEPDFLPSKKARMETGGESPAIRCVGLRSSNVNSCRVGDTLTSVPVSLAIAAF
ncbi:hypothetical protein AAFF_G00215840 [Aldrovandia affinis]|uniref:Immediate early response 2 n=1 Tax=Aldrovandia affinis TaxID=143900 RepID=A0AAD7W4S8_9TELE|nr:hypothetical protein AAFF_G00215840 [Aldrovandia affinis]